jgi:hypothetical protein
MSNKYQDWEDDDDTMEDDDPNSTDLVRKLRKSDRSKEKRIRDLESELNTIRSAQRGNSIKSILSEKGVNPKVAAFIPEDIDPTPEAVENWINEYAELFGLKNNASQVNLSQNDVDALREIDSVTSGALSPDKEQDLLLRLDQAQSVDDIINMINSAES